MRTKYYIGPSMNSCITICKREPHASGEGDIVTVMAQIPEKWMLAQCRAEIIRDALNQFEGKV